MQQHDATRESTEATTQFDAMSEALVCRLRGGRPEGLARVYERCQLGHFEVLCSASRYGVRLGKGQRARRARGRGSRGGR